MKKVRTKGLGRVRGFLLLMLAMLMFTSMATVAFAETEVYTWNGARATRTYVLPKSVKSINGLVAIDGGTYTYKFSYRDLEGEQLENTYNFMQAYKEAQLDPNKKYLWYVRYTSDAYFGYSIADNTKVTSYLFGTSPAHYNYYSHWDGKDYTITVNSTQTDPDATCRLVAGIPSDADINYDHGLATYHYTYNPPQIGSNSSCLYYILENTSFGVPTDYVRGVSKIAFEEVSGIDPTQHNLKINYNYIDGRQAHEPYTGTIYCNDNFRVESPEIPGYIASRKVVSGSLGSIATAQDMEIDVTYYPQTSSGGEGGIVNVTIPSDITLHIGGDNDNQTFEGTVELGLKNDGSPITLDTIEVQPNGWNITDDLNTLGVDKKNIALNFDIDGLKQRVTNTKNIIEAGVRVETGESLPYGFTYNYGTWTEDHDAEQAFIITVNYSVEGTNAGDGTLVTGKEVNEIIQNYPDIKNIIITDAVAPVEADTKDITVEKNWYIVYWVEGDTFTISTQRPGVKVKANEDMSNAFMGFKEVESIDISNLDTANTKNMSNMLFGMANIKNLDLTNINTILVETSENMLAGLNKLEEIKFGEHFGIQSNTSLVKPVNANIPGATGKWYNTTGEGFYPENIPENIEAVYSVFAPVDTLSVVKLNENLTNINTLEIGTKTPEDITNIILDSDYTEADVSLSGNGLVKLVKIDDKAYVYGASSGDIKFSPNTSHLLNSNSTVKNLTLGKYIKEAQNISSLLQDVSSLEFFDMNEMDTSNVTAMTNMLADCTALKEIHIDKINTSNVVSMGNLFARCTSLQSLDISGWDTKALLTDAVGAFVGCKKLQEIFVGENTTIHNQLPAQSATNIPDADGKWYNKDGTGYVAGSLPVDKADRYRATSKKLSTLSISKINSNMGQIVNLYIGTTDTPPADGTNPVDVSIEGNGGVLLTTVGTDGYVYSPNIYFTLQNTNMSRMADTAYCKYVEIGEYLKDAETLQNLFNYCDSLEKIDLSKLDTAQVQNMNGLFYRTYALKELKLPTSKNKTTDMGAMFKESRIPNLDFSGFDTSSAKTMESMFESCQIQSINFADIDTHNVESMSSMFKNVGNTTLAVDLSSLDTSNVKTMDYMFYGSSGVTEVNMTGLNVENVTTTLAMFYWYPGVSKLDLSSLYFSNCENMQSMFSNAPSLKELYLPRGTGKVKTFSCFLAGTSNLEILSGIEYFDVSSATDLSRMLESTKLSNFDGVENWDVSNATTMNSLFYNNNITKLDLSNWKPKKLTDMSGMFRSCGLLEYVDISNFDSDVLTNISYCFENCYNLKELYANNLNTLRISVPSGSYCKNMFSNAKVLKTIAVGENTTIQRCLNTPAVASIVGANGKWYSITDDTGYIVSQIPLSKSDTYTALAPYATLDFNKLRNNLGTATRLELGVIETLPEGGSDPVDVSTECAGKALLTIKDGTAYVCGNNKGLIEVGGNLSGLINSNVKNLKELKIGKYIKDVIYAYTLVNGNASLEEIDISELDLSKVTSYGYGILQGCTTVKKINFSNPTTSNMTDMRSMFYGCTNLEEVVLDNLDTSKVTTFASFFYNCAKLENIDLSMLDTSSLVSLNGLFNGCTSLTKYDISQLDTSKVTDWGGLFSNCSSIKSIDANLLDTSAATSMYGMFSGCSNLTDLKIDTMDVSKVTNMQNMFLHCDSLETLDISGWSNTSVTAANCNGMFNYDYKLKEITIGENVRYIQNKLLSLNGNYLPGADGKWYSKTSDTAYAPAYIPTGVHDTYTAIAPMNTLSITNLRAALGDATRLELGTIDTLPEGCSEPVDVSTELGKLIVLVTKDDTAYVVGMGKEQGVIQATSLTNLITANETKLKSIKIGNWVQGVTQCHNMFYNATHLEEADISELDLSQVTSYGYGIFNGCSSLKKVNFNNPTTGKITNLANTFSNCTSIKSLADIDISNLDTSSCTSFSQMFMGDTSLTDAVLPIIGSDKLVNTSQMFQNCTNLNNVDLRSLYTNNITNVSSMFSGCSSLESLDLSELNFLKASSYGSFVTGPKFIQVKTGVQTGNVVKGLPNQSYNYTPGANGKWYDLEGNEYASSYYIPVNQNNTYTAIAPYNYIDLNKVKNNLGTATKLEIGTVAIQPDGGSDPIDVGLENGGKVLLSIKNNTAYIYGTNKGIIKANALSNIITSSQSAIKEVKIGKYIEGVTSLYRMFYGCSQLEIVDINELDTSLVTRADQAFYGCTNLSDIQLSDIDTSKITNMQSMFYNCRKLSELDLSNWVVNITSTSYTSGMFNYCYALNTVIFGDGVKLLGSMLPTPSATYIPGADGKWHTVSGEAYTNSQIPNNKAETYFAVVPGDNTLFSDNQILEITNQLIFQDYEGNILATYPIVDSGFESLYPEALSETGYWSDPEQDENGNLIISWIEPEPSDIIADEILEDTTETIEIEEEDTPLASNNPASPEGTEGDLLGDNESEADQTEGQPEGGVEEGKSDGEFEEGQSDREPEGGQHTEGQPDGESEEAVDLNNGQSTDEEITEGKAEEQLDEADTDEEENSETLQLDTSDITE